MPGQSSVREVATLGGGCFWCLEAVYVEFRGVERVVSGYTGGHIVNPTYRQVCGADTGHVEVVQATFDPSVIAYRDLLDVFFTIHDPTTPNRQSPDIGPQYRSAIFTHSPEQAVIAKSAIADWTRRGLWRNPIVTEVLPASVFYPAEAYHQEYYANNADQRYCQIVIDPKLSKARKEFASRLAR
ncbi:MAG: peptide-methionine (S)-S-oxide reductase [Chloroflexota bacterium]|nr:MAG: peptide-methionine (S)-S-oxide reductase [Chloroflexota bacterium]